MMYGIMKSSETIKLVSNIFMFVVQLDLSPKGRIELQVRFYSETAPPTAEKDRELTVDEKRNTGGFVRRHGAIKHAKVHEVKDHQFRATFFRQPVFCSFCSEFMW